MDLRFPLKTPPEDRVRAKTAPELNEKLDAELEQRLRFYAAQTNATISERLGELDREWDIERALEANAASISLLGCVLGITRSRKWFIVPLLVSGFLLEHAMQGWCPPVPLFRRLGFRTRLEIEQERYALKLLRGDFKNDAEHANGAGSDISGLLANLRS